MRRLFDRDGGAADGRVMTDFDVPSAVPLRLDGETEASLAVAALVKGFDLWADFAKSVDVSMFPTIASLKLPEVVVAECAPAADSAGSRKGAPAGLGAKPS